MLKRENLCFSDVIFNTINYALLAAFMLICVYPFYYVLIYSLSDPQTVHKGIALLPSGFTLFNYIQIFELKNILNAFLISLLRSVIGTAVTVLCCSLFAFVLTKEKMYLRKIIYRLMVFTMYLNAGLIPYYLTVRMYGLRNSFLVYIIPSAVNAFYVILLKTFIEQLPVSLEESATIDGAGYLTIFRRLIFPLSMPIIATIAVFSSVGQWNSWFDNYIFCTGKSLNTLQNILLKYLEDSSRIADLYTVTSSGIKPTPDSVRMTMTMIVIFPILLVYPFMQRYFTKGIMLGAIKG